MEATPYSPMMRSAAEITAARALRTRDFKAADVHLRSSAHVIGYDIQATDESIGHVQDFIFDDHNWAIRYLVVDTRNWWPGGRKVLIGMHWADRIDWATQKVHVRLTREQVMSSPLFEDVSSIHRDYELRSGVDSARSHDESDVADDGLGAVERRHHLRCAIASRRYKCERGVNHLRVNVFRVEVGVGAGEIPLATEERGYR